MGDNQVIEPLASLLVEKIQSKYGLGIRNLRKAFSSFDVDKNGLLTVSELTVAFGRMLNGIPTDVVQRLAYTFDINSDGKITIEELSSRLTDLASGRPVFPERPASANVMKAKNATIGGRGGGVIGDSRYSDAALDGRQPTPRSTRISNAESRYAPRDPEPYSPRHHSVDDDEDIEAMKARFHNRRHQQRGGDAHSDMAYSYGDNYDNEPAHYAEDVDNYSEQNYREYDTPNSHYDNDYTDDVSELPEPEQHNWRGHSTSHGNTNRGSTKLVSNRLVLDSTVASATRRPQAVPADVERAAHVVQGEVCSFLNSLKKNWQTEAHRLRVEGRLAGAMGYTAQQRLVRVAEAWIKQYFPPRAGARRPISAAVQPQQFINVMQSLDFAGEGLLSDSAVEYLTDLCLDESDLVQPWKLLTLVFGDGKGGKSYVDQMQSGRTEISRGPLPRADVVEKNVTIPRPSTAAEAGANSNAPLRLISRRQHASMPLPSSMDIGTQVARSSSLPEYQLRRAHVFGMSSTRYSGHAFRVIPFPPSHVGSSMPSPTIVYPTACLGVVVDFAVPVGGQTYPALHSDDITCLALSSDGTLAATGCMGKSPVVKIWHTKPRNMPRPPEGDEAQYGYGEIMVLGEGFFDRAVCTVQFSVDNRFLFANSCDDYHTIGVFDLRKGKLVAQASCLQGIPGQVKWMAVAPALTPAQYITKEHPMPCDLFVTTGERHLRFWSFRRPDVSGDGHLDYKGAVHGKSLSDVPKVFTTAGFIASQGANPTFSLAAGGDNGFVGLYRDAKLVVHTTAFRQGSVHCLEVVGDKIVVGGTARGFGAAAPVTATTQAAPISAKSAGSRLIKVLDGRTLEILREFDLGRTGVPSATLRPGSTRPGSARASSATRPRPGSASSTTGTARRPTSSSGSRMVTARAPPPKAPTHAAGVATNARQSSLQLGMEESSTIEHIVEEEERGPNTITGIAVISGQGRSTIGATYMLVSLGSGRLIRLDCGALNPDTPGAKTDFLVRDIFRHHTGSISGLTGTLSGSSGVVVTVGDDRQLFAWDPSTLRPVARAALKAASRCCHLDKSGHFIAIGDVSGALTLMHLPVPSGNPTVWPSTTTGGPSLGPLVTPRECAYRKDARGEITVVKFSPSNTRLATGSRDDCIYIYSVRLDHDEISSARGTGGRPASAPRARGSSSVSSTANGVPRVTLSVMHKLRGHSSTILSLDWTLDSLRLYSGSQAYEILCWDVETGRRATASNDPALHTRSVPGPLTLGAWPVNSHGSDINTFDVCPSRSLLVTATDAYGLVRLNTWPSIVKYAPAREYPGHSSHCQNAQFFLNGDIVASVGGADSSVVLWDVVAIVKDFNSTSSRR